jgi:hypothetical protein
MPAPNTLILRFRDLVTSTGDTLARHREIVAKPPGQVWWGWWHKDGERAPYREFKQLAVVARSPAGLDILLFDSGRKTLHKAHCTEIKWETDEAIEAPDPALTPSYYRRQRYRAWFRFDRIEDYDTSDAPTKGDPVAIERALRAWSYRRVDGFFDVRPSRFDAFYDKRVHSLEELRQQDRSIWFLQPFEEAHRIHEVSLLDARTLKPENYPATYEQIEEDSLLWLSDTHWSVDHHHAFADPADRSRPGERSLDVALQRELAGPVHTQFSRGGPPLAWGGILHTGDVTWRAAAGEFEQGYSALGQLLDGRSSYRLAMCPGNHDLAFSTDPADKDTPIRHTGPRARAGWVDFYKSLFYIPPTNTLASGRRFLMGNTVPVEIACLNSCHLQQHKDLFQGHGWIGDDQLEEVELGMGWRDRPARAFRMVMLHHHVVPVTHRELPRAGASYSVVLDAVALLRWCVKFGVRLILHGHMHQPHVTRLSMRNEAGAWHTITIASMGSSGVEQGHLGEVGKNTFGLLRFADDAAELTWHTVHRTNPSEELTTLAVRVPYRGEP